MKRIKLRFADIDVEFVDREKAIEKFVDWAKKGTHPVQVVFGPEGCGKTALLRQAVELLKEYGYSVALVSPLSREPGDRFTVTEELLEFAKDVFSSILSESISGVIDFAIHILYRVIRERGRKKIALLLDDVFQAIGLDRAALLVKSLLNMIEHPSINYERIVIVVTTSEGMSRWEIGRHRWADLIPLWNMSKDGFKQLYDSIPGFKPPFEDVWRWSGGNPEVLERLYRVGWDVDKVVKDLIMWKRLSKSFTAKWRKWLEPSIDDPDYLWEPETPEELVKELEERNLIMYFLSDRDEKFWLDTAPPVKDPELGIGRRVAWQTPLHREAVRRALEEI